MAENPRPSAEPLPHAHPARPLPATRARKPWDDVPLRIKISCLLAVAVVWGAAIGILHAHLGHKLWILALSLSLLFIIVTTLGRRWIWLPYEKLVNQISRVSRGSLLSMRSLPMERLDELGQIARAIHRVTVTARRDHHEARHLRRTLDDRIDRATRAATAQLSHLAMRDPLTNLANRRFLSQHLDELVDSCIASNTDLVCVLIDLDNFKLVNDQWGHPTGDELLQFVGGLIGDSVRRGDYAVRYGGDEFIVFMPGAEVQRSQEFAEHLRQLYRAHLRATMPTMKGMGLSVGIASLSADAAHTGAGLVEAADRNLYAAKTRGKDRVHLTGEG